MRPHPIKTAGAFLCAVLLPLAAQAQGNCSARETVVSKLASSYGESFAGGGLQSSTSIFEVWMSEEKGTWTILMTRPDGSTCIMASGTHWRDGLPTSAVVQGTPS